MPLSNVLVGIGLIFKILDFLFATSVALHVLDTEGFCVVPLPILLIIVKSAGIFLPITMSICVLQFWDSASTEITHSLHCEIQTQ